MSSLGLLWRSVCDGVYGFTAAFLQREDIHGRKYLGLSYFPYRTQHGIRVSSRRTEEWRTRARN